MKTTILLLIFSILALGMIFLVDYFLIEGMFLENKLVINEYMSINNTVLQDKDFNYPDWIEIYNGSAFPVNLSDFGLNYLLL